jgi:small subunit ribosomal protein S6
VKRYEGLFILNTAGKEEGVNDLVDKLKAEIASLGANVETVQKMEKRPFSRQADDNKLKEGFYVNFIFEAGSETLRKLQSHFALSEDVFRTLFTEIRTATPAK